MVLYAAKLKEKAKPVSDLNSVDKKGSRSKKKEKTQLEDQVPPPPPPMDKKEEAKLKRREKALLKKQEKELELKRQEEETKKALAEKEAELKAAEEALAAKKQAQKEKRKLKRQAKKTESVTDSNPSVETIETNSTEATLVAEKPKKTRKRKQVTIEEQVDQEVEKLNLSKKKPDVEPPEWFKKYVAGVKNEESLHRSPKKPKREIAKEANQVAKEQWGNGLVRDRVRNEVDQHMSRMYQMIFNRGF